jgi:hypothetical protein
LDITRWEEEVSIKLKSKSSSDIERAGSFLQFVPSHDQWEGFLTDVRTAWKDDRRGFLDSFPNSLVVLYSGLAFYDYDDAGFWKFFSKRLDITLPKPNHQKEINSAFAKSAKRIGLKIIETSAGTSFVGSAVHHIGVPLSLWDGFIDICNWALKVDYQALSYEDWRERISKRLGSRRRLITFLTENRDVANIILQELIDARKVLSEDQSLTIDDLKQACLLRMEYFDEVPETADFLRPNNPDSLFKDRPRIVWNQRRGGIDLHLPRVPEEFLPAEWDVDGDRSQADSGAILIPLDGKVFKRWININLHANGKSEHRRLRGLAPWGLFDLERSGRLVGNGRETLPLRNFIFASNEKIESVHLEGFDTVEGIPNESHVFRDGSVCYLTKLYPTNAISTLRIHHKFSDEIIQFRTKDKMESQIFFGTGFKAAYYYRVENKLKFEVWPTVCVAIPKGYWQDDEIVLSEKFKITVDSHKAHGHWQKREPRVDTNREYYFWKWENQPFLEIKSGNGEVIRDFKDLRKCVQTPVLLGERQLSIHSPEFGLALQYPIVKEKACPTIDKRWGNLPGKFLPFFLLCQSDNGYDWDDLMLAKEAIAPCEPLFSSRLLRHYEDHGLLIERGGKWIIVESRAVINAIDGKIEIEYCGAPPILWHLYRIMQHVIAERKLDNNELPMLEVVDKRGFLPFLRMTWKAFLRREIESHFRRRNVVMRSSLWNH